MKAKTPLITLALFILISFFNPQSVKAQCGPVHDIVQSGANDRDEVIDIMGNSFIATCDGEIEAFSFWTHEVLQGQDDVTVEMYKNPFSDNPELLATGTIDIGTHSASSQGVEQYVLFDNLSEVESGTEYGIRIIKDSPNSHIDIKYDDRNPYTQGNMFIFSDFRVPNAWIPRDLKFHIHYKDEPPIARCRDLTVILDANGEASINASDVNNGSTTQGGFIIYNGNINFDCSNLGSNNFIDLSISANGLTDSCTATITVISGNYADIQCSNYIVANDPGQSFATILPTDFDGSNITINDNGCPSDTFTGSYSPSGFGFTYFIGQPRQVTYTYTNNYGEEQSCTFNVIVNDTEAPVLGGCPTTDVVLLEGETLQEPSLTGSSDNYDTNNQLVIERLDAGPAFGTVPTSDFTVQYRIVDTSGNESSICSYNVIVDNAPVITCQSPSVIIDENTSTYELTLNELASATNDLSVTANLAFGTGTEVSVVLDNNSPTDQILNIPTGFHYQLFELIPPTTGSYTFTLSGNNSSNLFIWEDSFNPNTGDFALRPGYVGFASFNANGSLAQGSNNNTFTLQRGKTYYMSVLEDGENVFFTGTLAFSSELIYENGPSSITLDLDCSDAGTIIPTNKVYAYEDNGQNTSCVPSINATENIAPEFIDCPTDITVDIDPNSTGAIVNFTLNATDNCTATQDLQISQTSGLGSGELFPTGETIQTFTVTDAAGNTGECTFTITVEDTEAPIISCQDVTLPELPTTDIGYIILPSDFDNGSTDNSSQLDFLAEYDQFYINIDNTSPVHSNLYHQSSIFMVPSNGAYTFDFDLIKNDEGAGTFVPQFRYSIWNIPPTENGDGLIADTTIDIATGQVVSGNTTTTFSAGVKYYMHVYAASSTSTTFENLTGTMSVDASISSSLPMFVDCSTVNIDDVTITAIDGVGNTDTCTASVSVSNISCPIELIILPTANQDFQLPFMPYTSETYTVDWGDGTSTTGHTGYTSHTYALAAEYTIKVYGNISYFRFSDVDLNDANAPILKSVVSWGDNVWETMLEAFNGCSNLESLPVTPPNLSNVTNMNHMFARASIFNQDISNWDVSNVTDMEGVFAATIFNQPLNGWNVSNVTTMEGMFLSATEFNQPLNNWNVSNVINMTGMFLDAYAFNGDITTWNTSNLVNANGMFATASSFNQNLGTWDISSLNNAFAMFSNTSLSTTNYDNLLIGWANLDAGETQIPTGTAFDAPQSRYCNGEAARTELMSTYGWAISDGGRDQFCGVSEEELFITEWNANGNRIIEIPTNGNGYNYSIDWGDGTFSYNQTGNVSHEYTSTGQYDVKIYGDFPRIHFGSSTSTNRTKIREVKQWGAIEWSSMEGAFLECSNLKVTATDIPNLSNVTNTSSMFKDCTSLTENDMFNNWDMSNVSNMNNMFESATNLDQNVGNWDITSLVTANNMFTDTALSYDNYDALLIGWSTQEAGEGSIPNSVSFNASGYTYCNGENARLNLLFNNFWNISGDGPDEFCGLGRPFITEWQLALEFQTIEIPTTGSGYDYVIDWGDGSDFEDATVEYDQTGDASHQYDLPGTYVVKIYGDFPRIDFSSSTGANKSKIRKVTQWGDIQWSTMLNAFTECNNLRVTASDTPDLSNVTSLQGMFNSCTFLVGNDSFNNWDVSNVSNMINMFNNAISFNQNIDNWDITSLDNASSMFGGVTLSTENYDALLIGWSTQEAGEGPIPSNVNFNAGNSRYCNGEIERARLITNFSWSIDDGQQDPTCGLISEPFITTWNTDVSGTSNSSSIIIPTFPGEVYNYTVLWGDGTLDEGLTGNAFHEYATPGIYEVKIYGDFPRIYFEAFLDPSGPEKILEVNQWGNIQWSSMHYAFSKCKNLTVNATDVPDLSNVDNMSYMFNEAELFNTDINSWDVSNVTYMDGVFLGARSFNQDISSWDVSNVTHMSVMFYEAESFNQDINSWDVSNVTYMSYMFFGATSFDQNLGDWDITSLDIINNMFAGVTLSTENYDALLIGWATQEAGEGPIPTGLEFNGGGSQYCDGEAARIELENTYGWTINDGNQEPLCGFEPFITKWNVEAGESITIPTTGGGYNYTVDWGDGTIDQGITGDASHTFASANEYEVKVFGNFPRIDFSSSSQANKAKIKEVTQWGDIQWSTMLNAFTGCGNLNVTASDTPDLSNVTNLQNMFNSCASLVGNNSFNNWDVSNVTNMSIMFIDAVKFNSDISGWNVSSVTEMAGMFSRCTDFNQPLNNWDVSNVNAMAFMFDSATSFDQNLGDWDITSLVNAAGMLNNVALSTENYDALLIGWADDTSPLIDDGIDDIPSGATLGAYGLIYCLSENDRQTLIDDHGWIINGDSLCNTIVITCESPTVTLSADGTYDLTPAELASATSDLSTPTLAFGTGLEIPVNIDDENPSDALTAGSSYFYELFELKPPTTGDYTFNIISEFGQSFVIIWEGEFNENGGNFDTRPGYLGIAIFNQDGTVSNGPGSNTFTLESDKTYYLTAANTVSNSFLDGTLTFSSEMIYINKPSLTVDSSDVGTTIPINVFAYEDNGNSSSCLSNVTVEEPIKLSPKVYLQGASLNPNTGEESLMRDDLRVNGLIPTTSPYSDNSTCEASVFNTGGTSGSGVIDNDIVDWVWVELRGKNDNTIIVDSQSALLQRDGDVVSIDGISSLVFEQPEDNYYVAIKHRNHLGIMSNSVIPLSASTTLVNFSDGNIPTYGTNTQTTFGMPTGVLGLWAGNVDGGSTLRYLGSSNDTNAIKDKVLADPGNSSGSSLYFYDAYDSGDVNLNGRIRYQGSSNDSNIIKDIIFSHPNNGSNNPLFIINEQLPENN